MRSDAPLSILDPMAEFARLAVAEGKKWGALEELGSPDNISGGLKSLWDLTIVLTCFR